MLKNKWVNASIWILIASIIILSPIILNKTAIMGVDSYFHYNRIYESAMQLRHWNFSFLNLYSFQHAGRVVDQVYSPLVTYFFGAILLVVHNWMRFQIISIMLVCYVAGISMYAAAQKLKLTHHLSVTLSLIYLSSFSIYSFIFGTNWRALSMAIVPLLMGSIVTLYHGDWSSKYMLHLGIVVALLAQIQLLTTLLVLPILLPFFIRGLRHAQHKLVQLGKLLISILTALILSLNVILPYLELVQGNTILPPSKLVLTQGVTNLIVPSDKLTQSLSIAILCLVFYLGLGGLIYFWKQTSTFVRLLLITASVYIILGTSLTPWMAIEKSWPVLANFLQLPRRFTIIGIPLLLLGVGQLYNNLSVKKAENHQQLLSYIGTILAAASVLSLALAVTKPVSAYNNPTVKLAKGLQTSKNHAIGHHFQGKKVKRIIDIQPAFHTRNLSTLIQIVDRTTPDYVPVDKVNDMISYYVLYDQQIINKQYNYNYQVKPAGVLQLNWHSKQAKTLQVPVVAYHRTTVTLNGQTLKHSQIKQTNLGAVIVKAQAGKNTLQLSYRPKLSTRMGIWLAMFGWFLIPIIWCYQKLTTQRSARKH